MARYGADGRCLMRVLQEELDDPEPGDCGRCAVCTEPRFADPPDARLVERAAHLRARPIELEVKKMAPDAHGAMRKIADDARTEPGWALARFGDGGWWPAVARGLSGGAFDDEVVQALAGVVRAQVRSAAWVCAVPSAAWATRSTCSRSGSPTRSGSRSRRCWRAPSRALPNGRWRTRWVRRRTCVARFASPRRRRAGPGCCSTTAAAPAGRWRWSAVSFASPAPSGWCHWLWAPCSDRRLTVALRCGGSSTSYTFGGAPRIVSQLDLPVCATGRLTVAFAGDPAAGCATEGLCDYAGTETFSPAAVLRRAAFTVTLHGIDFGDGPYRVATGSTLTLTLRRDATHLHVIRIVEAKGSPVVGDR